MKTGRQRQLISLKVPPGLVLDSTESAASGYWRDGMNVRWHPVRGQYYTQKIGGFQPRDHEIYMGSCRWLYRWSSLNGTLNTAIGTHKRLYVERDGTNLDVTPIIATHNVTDAITTVAGETHFTVELDTPHFSSVGDWIILTPTSGVGGIPLAGLKGEFEVTEIIDAVTFGFDLVNPAITSQTGGGATKVEILLPTGLDRTEYGYGWGAGGWGRGTWGGPADDAIAFQRLALWSGDNFGEDLFCVRRGSPIFHWDSTNPMDRVKDITTLPDQHSAPHSAEWVLVSERDGHLIAFGCEEYLGDGKPNPMHVRWSDQENPLNWVVDRVSTSGGLTLGSGSRIVAVKQTRQSILIFTDKAVYAMTYVGGTYVFNFELIGQNISIMGPNAIAVFGDTMMWMGKKGFYRYDGTITYVPCDIETWLDLDFNHEEFEKATAGINQANREFWWSYPSKDSLDCDVSIFCSMETGAFSRASFGRTAWYDGDYADNPIGAFNGRIYDHEIGYDDATDFVVNPLVAYVQSSSIEIADGQDVMFADLFIFDADFEASPDSGAELVHTLTASDWPGDADHGSTSATAKRLTVIPYTITGKKSIRLRGRSMSMRIESDKVGARWTLGVPRIRVRTDGER
jgi:hypothetical protein